MNTPLYKRKFLALSCVTALASFALIAKPALADEMLEEHSINTEVVTKPVSEVVASTDGALSDTTATPSFSVEDQAPAAPEIENLEQKNTGVATDTTASPVVTEMDRASTPVGENVRSDATENTTDSETSEQVVRPSLANRFVLETEEKVEKEVVAGSSIYYLHTPYEVINYYDSSGRLLTGWQSINGERYYFQNREQAGFETIDDKVYYVTKSGRVLTNQFIEQDGQNYYLGDDGVQYSGLKTIDNHVYYFSPGRKNQLAYGLQVIDGKTYYFQERGSDKAGQQVFDSKVQTGDLDLNIDASGQVQINHKYPDFVSDQEGNWYFLNAQGQLVTGPQTIDGITYYFDNDGRQVKGEYRTINQVPYFFDPDNGALATNRIVTFNNGVFIPENKYAQTIHFSRPIHDNYYDNEYPNLVRNYLGPDGQPLTGWQTVDGREYYFLEDGNMAVHRLLTIDGKSYFFYPNGSRARNTSINITTHYILREFNNIYTFDQNGAGEITSHEFYPPGPGFVSNGRGGYHYIYSRGNPAVGAVTIDGFELYFDPRDGLNQVKDQFILIGGHYYYYDKHDGRKVKNTSFTRNGISYLADPTGIVSLPEDGSHKNQYFSDDKGNWYYADSEGNLLIGPQTIDHVDVFFDADGRQVKGNFASNGYFYDKDTGQRVINRLVTVKEKTYYLDDKGDKVRGRQNIDGMIYYFDEAGVAIKNGFDSQGYFYGDDGHPVTNRYINHDDFWYYLDSEGKKLLGQQRIDSVNVYFDEYGRQIKGRLVIKNSAEPYNAGSNATPRHRVPSKITIQYFDKDTGARAENTVLTIDKVTYAFDHMGQGRVIR